MDINNADAVTLVATLNGVGVDRAEAIGPYREQHGPFHPADGLKQVRGIGGRVLQKNRALSRLSGNR
ncbi:MAG TPA: hypothetical protein ENK50_09420 [Sedimenticola sp.]|nr:hypothetical protein [Sedimenticola sp.]